METVDAYIAAQPAAIQPRLHEIRAIIKSVVPDAIERISYKMPAYTLASPVVYFGKYKNHIGMYPLPAGDAAFQEALAPFATHKSTARFPHKQPLPVELIKEIVRLRAEESLTPVR